MSATSSVAPEPGAPKDPPFYGQSSMLSGAPAPLLLPSEIRVLQPPQEHARDLEESGGEEEEDGAVEVQEVQGGAGDGAAAPKPSVGERGQLLSDRDVSVSSSTAAAEHLPGGGGPFPAWHPPRAALASATVAYPSVPPLPFTFPTSYSTGGNSHMWAREHPEAEGERDTESGSLQGAEGHVQHGGPSLAARAGAGGRGGRGSLPDDGSDLREALLGHSAGGDEATGAAGGDVGEDLRPPTWAESVGWGEMMAAYSQLEDGTPLHSLNVLRGLVLLAMVLAPMLEGSVAQLRPSPWNGLTVRDALLPLLVYTVGVSSALAFNRVPTNLAVANKIYLRFAKLLYLGMIVQGGFFHASPPDTSFGVSLERFRYCGVLQVIGAAFLVVAMSEMAVMGLFRASRRPPGIKGLAASIVVNWGVACGLLVLYLYLTFAVRVPDWDPRPIIPPTAADPWPRRVHGLPGSLQGGATLSSRLLLRDTLAKATTQAATSPAPGAPTGPLVVCSMARGELGPACNAAGYVDRALFGLTHLKAPPPYAALPDCSGTAAERPSWCQAPFDPEGTLSTIGAALVAFAGLHHGHVLAGPGGAVPQALHGLLFSGVLLAAGFGLTLPLPLGEVLGWDVRYQGMPLNASVFSVSFTLVTAGLAAFLFSLLRVLVDRAPGVQGALSPLAWVGRNPLFVLVFGVCGMLEVILQGLYFHDDPTSNIAFLVGQFFRDSIRNAGLYMALRVITLLLSWVTACGILVHSGLVMTM